MPLYQFDNGRVRFQWQRIALARAFMRAHQREVHFLLFDEPVRPLSVFLNYVNDTRRVDVCSRRSCSE